MKSGQISKRPVPPSYKMEPNFLKKPYYNLYLVRHGESMGNYYRIFGGWMDLPLTQAGKEELEQLKGEIPYPEADLYRHSGLIRAKHTLKIISGKQDIAQQDWRFSESYFGIKEGSIPEDYQVNEEFYTKFYQDIPQGQGEELFSEQRIRVLKACLDLLAELKDLGLNSAYIFGHYGTIKSALFSFVPGLSHNLESKEIIPNGSLWHFLFEDQGQRKSSRQSESLRDKALEDLGLQRPQSTMRCLLVRSYWGQGYQDLVYQAEGFAEAGKTILESASSLA